MQANKKFDKIRLLSFSFLPILAVYLFTNAPSVVQIDSGELATVQLLPGVAHPTGYPVFIMAGFILSKIFFFVTPQIKFLNLLASFYVLLSLVFFSKSAMLMLENIEPDKFKRKLLALSSSFLLGFSFTFWSQSASVEVYSLHLFLTSVVIYRLLTAFRTNSKRDWLYFSAALAFSFGNHMTTVMLLPSIAYLFFYKNRFDKNAFYLLAAMLIVFIPIIIAEYAFLVFLAQTEPKLNWGDVSNLHNLFRHFTGKQYQVWMFSGLEVAKKQFAYFVMNLGKEFAYVGLIPVLIGVFSMKKNERPFFVFTLILFFSVIAYAINYNIHDIDSYFLLAYVALGFFSVFGFRELLIWIEKSSFAKFAYPVIFAFGIIEILVSFSGVSQSDNWIFEDYTKSALQSVEKNSIILTYQWDYFVSPSYYFRYIENFRADVAVVDKELLRRSWYYKQLAGNYPFVFSGLGKTVANFLQALKPFESGEPFNSALLEKLYREIISGIIADNVKTCNVYIAPELVDNELKRGEFRLPEGYTLVPCDYFFKVVPKKNYYDEPLKVINIRFDNSNENKYTAQIKRFVQTMMIRRALYEMQFDKKDKAREIILNYRKLFPDAGLPKVFASLF